MITVIINGLDISQYIQQTVDIEEQMRKIYGDAHDETIDGSMIPNLVAVKWDPSFVTVPMPQSIANQLLTFMEQETVNLEYTSFKVANGQMRTITALPQTVNVSYAMDTATGTRIYQAARLVFQEQ